MGIKATCDTVAQAFLVSPFVEEMRIGCGIFAYYGKSHIPTGVKAFGKDPFGYHDAYVVVDYYFNTVRYVATVNCYEAYRQLGERYVHTQA